MYGILILAAIPATLAAGFDSVGLALLAGAGVAWAAALYICSTVPVIAGSAASLNERLSTGLSILAASLVSFGLLVLATDFVT